MAIKIAASNQSTEWKTKVLPKNVQTKKHTNTDRILVLIKSVVKGNQWNKT